MKILTDSYIFYQKVAHAEPEPEPKADPTALAR